MSFDAMGPTQKRADARGLGARGRGERRAGGWYDRTGRRAPGCVAGRLVRRRFNVARPRVEAP